MANELLRFKDEVTGEVEKVPSAGEGAVPTEAFDGSVSNVFLPVRYFEEDWVPGTKKAGTMSVDSGWTMLSNKDTEERPAPQPSGDPSWAFTDTPAFITNSDTSVVHSGQTFTFTKSGWLERIRVWVPELSGTTHYRIIIADLTNPSVPLVEIIENPALIENGWATIAAGSRVVSSGTVLEITIDAINEGLSTNVSGGWTRASNGAVPAAGEWSRSSNNRSVFINKTDLDTNDKSTELEGATIDSNISFVQTLDTDKSQTYLVVDLPIDHTTYMEYPTSAISSGPSGQPDVGAACTTDIEVPTPASTQYSELTDHWLTDPPFATVEGFLEFNGIDQAGHGDDGYGVDIRFQEAYVSPDWAFVASSSVGAGSTTVMEAAVTQTINILNTDTVVEAQAKIDAIPKYIPLGVTVTIQGSTAGSTTFADRLLVAGFYGGGKLNIQGNTSEADATVLHTTQEVVWDFTSSVNTTCLDIQDCSVQVIVINIRFDSSDGDTCIRSNRVYYFQYKYNYFNLAGTSSPGRGVLAQWGSVGQVASNYCTGAQYVIYSLYNSQVFSNNNDDTGTQPQYGLFASNAGVIGKSGTQPSGSVSDEKASANGGVIR